MRTARERDGAVQKGLGPGDHLRAAGRIIGPAAGRAGDGVGAIESVIEVSPSRVGRVQQEAGVQRRHDQLRARPRRHLGIDIERRDRERGRRLDDVADLAQEGGVVPGVDWLTPPHRAPNVDLLLQRASASQKRSVLRREPRENVRCAAPEAVRHQPGSDESARFDELGERRGDLELGAIHISDHRRPPQCPNAVYRSNYLFGRQKVRKVVVHFC